MIKTIFNYFYNLFNEHPNSANMSYFRHMMLSLKFSFLLFVSSIQALIHAILPFLCKTSTSDVIIKINKMLHKAGCKKKKPIQHSFNYNFAV
jgi:hypothetical protein